MLVENSRCRLENLVSWAQSKIFKPSCISFHQVSRDLWNIHGDPSTLVHKSVTEFVFLFTNRFYGFWDLEGQNRSKLHENKIFKPSCISLHQVSRDLQNIHGDRSTLVHKSVTRWGHFLPNSAEFCISELPRSPSARQPNCGIVRLRATNWCHGSAEFH